MGSRYQTRLPAPKLFVYCFLVLLASLVAANTEIRNFRVGGGDSAGSTGHSLSSSSSSSSAGDDGRTWVRAQGGGFGVLDRSHNERSFRVRGAPVGTALGDVCEGEVWTEELAVVKKGSGSRSCPHELWLLLDLGAAAGSDDDEEEEEEEDEGWWAWNRFKMFTTRLSWPAFYPADFDITLYSPEELDAYMHSVTRHRRIAESFTLDSSDEIESDRERRRWGRPSSSSSTRTHSRVRYARIRLVDTGIRPRNPSSSSSSSPPSSSNKTEMQGDENQEVPFIVILEPLLFNILPVSLIPTILLLVPLLVGVALAYPYVMRYLEGVAAEASKELYGRKRKVQ